MSKSNLIHGCTGERCPMQANNLRAVGIGRRWGHHQASFPNDPKGTAHAKAHAPNRAANNRGLNPDQSQPDYTRPGVGSFEDAQSAGYGRIVQGDDGLYYPGRNVNATDFVATYDFPDFEFDFSGLLLENPEDVDIFELGKRASEFNLERFGENSVASLLNSLFTGSVINKFTFNQFDRYVSDIDPDFKTLRGKSADQILSFLDGEVPDDVAELIRIRSAERGNSRGLGGVRTDNLSARDLGLTSLALIEKGIDASEKRTQFDAQLTADLLFDTQAHTASFHSQLNQGSFITPAQAAYNEQQNRDIDLRANMFNSNLGVMEQQENYKVAVDRAGAEYFNDNNYLNAALTNYNNRLKELNEDDSGVWGTVGRVVGSVAGMFLPGGSEVWGAIGGAAGDFAGGGNEGTAASITQSQWVNQILFPPTASTTTPGGGGTTGVPGSPGTSTAPPAGTGPAPVVVPSTPAGTGSGGGGGTTSVGGWSTGVPVFGTGTSGTPPYFPPGSTSSRTGATVPPATAAVGTGSTRGTPFAGLNPGSQPDLIWNLFWDQVKRGGLLG